MRDRARRFLYLKQQKIKPIELFFKLKLIAKVSHRRIRESYTDKYFENSVRRFSKIFETYIILDLKEHTQLQ